MDASFLPRSDRTAGERTSIYVERAFLGGVRPTRDEVAAYGKEVVAELRSWDFIGEADVVDPSWIDVAYTWALPGSHWREQAIRLLADHEILMVGRYGEWSFQGIADSIRDGFFTGVCFRES